ncbi:MAG TPA: TonB-dependent receptor [Gammaproteobacteria bacterium]|nr:TonB-dependent receptor [Gammaproteobacteria bacterium]
MAIALGMCFAGGTAWAANKSSGGIYGEAPAGANNVVIVTSDTGLTRQVVVGSDGRFEFSALPIGTYTVQLQQNGSVTSARTVQVSLATSTHVGFGEAAQSLGTIQVVGGAINPIDVTTASTSLVLSDAQFEKLPVARNTTDVALLAPTTVRGDPSFGLDVPSFGGASIAENAYFLNGLNITDAFNFTAYARPPFESLAQYQVKTGGLDAAWGHALGGIINMVSKSGTNQFHAGANVYWIPRGLYASSPDVLHVNDAGEGYSYFTRLSDDDHSELTYNLYGSGPIVKDHLFFYALYQGQDIHDDNFTTTQFQPGENSTPQGLVKIDWQINSNNVLELTAFSSAHDNEFRQYTLVRNGSTWFDPNDFETLTQHRGSEAYIGKYTATITSDFSLSGMWGYITFDQSQDSSSDACPYAIDFRTNGGGEAIGCWTTFSIPGKEDYDARHQVRIDGEWNLGPHDITFGYDWEKFFVSSHTIYTGGVRWDYLPTPDEPLDDGGVLTPVPVSAGPNNGPLGGESYAFKRHFENGAEFNTVNTAFYAQDNWRINNFYLRLGARFEKFQNNNPAGVAFIETDYLFEPRLGLSWDVFGDSSLKVYGNFSRQYMPVAMNTNVRLSGSELDYHEYYTYDGINPDGSPINPQLFSDRFIISDGSLPDASRVVAQNIDPMYQDEFILGAQQRLTGTQWSFGLRGIRRELKSAMDDVCTFRFAAFDAITYLEQTYGADPAYVAATAPTCVLINPGQDVVWNISLHPGEEPQNVTIPADALGVPKATRYYNAVELLFERAFDGKWFLNGSLTWSHSYGNEEGYVLSDIAQDDAGITEAFDFPGLTEGAYGNLPNDRTWVLKMFGAWQFAPEWRVGANFYYSSGQPLSCFGLYAGYRSFATLYGNDSHYCGGQLVTRGSAGRLEDFYSLDGSIHYLPSWAPGLTFGMSVVNIFNFQHATDVSQTGETSGAVPVNTYLLPTAYQQPRYFRFSVEYDFM